jgi:UDPglucose 6-dehydrogenase
MRQFKEKADLPIANRLMDDLNNVADQIYSRDLYGNN